jgi:hypothetical protein
LKVRGSCFQNVDERYICAVVTDAAQRCQALGEARFLPLQHAETRPLNPVFAQRAISPVKWLVDPRKLSVA